jgi:hypothetical protein
MITALTREELIIMQRRLSIVEDPMAGRLVVCSAAVSRDLVTLRSSMCDELMMEYRRAAEAL